MPVRVALFLIAIILPTDARGQQPTAAQRSFPQAQRPIAPPAVQQIPPGSASTSADERRTMEAVRMADGETITLDGRLDEDVWMRAVPATNFMQLDPDNGQPATEQTEVRIVYNADKLYMGVTLFDSEPDKLIYYQMGRDGNLPADDKLQWAIDTFHRWPHRLLVGDEPVGLDGRRPAGRQQHEQPAVGRDLGRPIDPQRDWMDARDRSPVPDA